MTVSMDETWFKWTRGKPIAFRWHDARRQHALAVAGKEITNLIGKLFTPSCVLALCFVEWHASQRIALQHNLTNSSLICFCRHPPPPPLLLDFLCAGPDSRTTLLACVLSGAQVYIAYRCRVWTWATVCAAAATCGALIAYDLQALCHEMGHHRAHVQRPQRSAARQRDRKEIILFNRTSEKPTANGTSPRTTEPLTRLAGLGK